MSAAAGATATDSSWPAFLARKKRDAVFKRKVSELHKVVCGCPNYLLHFQRWPTTTEKSVQAGGELEPTREEETGEDIGDETIIEAGDGIGPDVLLESR